MTNAASERGIKAARAKAAADAEEEKIVIRNLMRTAGSRRWVWLRLAECNIFVESDNLDPQLLAYRQGQRNIGLRLLASVTRICPQEYVMMTQENTSAVLTSTTGPQEEDNDDDN
jgi:hypothetical protein